MTQSDDERLPTLLSVIAGSVDVIGYLSLGLFTAHVTGNFLTLPSLHQSSGAGRSNDLPPGGCAGHRVAAIKTGIVNTAAGSRAVAFGPGIEIAIRPTVAERTIRIAVRRPLCVSARGGERSTGQREAERHGGCRDEIYPRPIHFHLRLDDICLQRDDAGRAIT